MPLHRLDSVRFLKTLGFLAIISVKFFHHIFYFYFLVIKTLAKIFDQRNEFRSVNAICAAKVPIVKFDYTFSGVTYEGDISYYNILGKRNLQYKTNNFV